MLGATKVIHNFQSKLNLSHKFENAPWWEQVYRKAFFGFDGMHSVRQDGWAQRAGIDRQVFLKSGKIIEIDEKVRTKVYPDILLERWSDKERKIPGWVQKDLKCDYIAYAFIPSKTCYLLPFPQLRKAWIDNGKEWIEIYGTREAKNEGWVTESVPVPIDILLVAISCSQIVIWN